MKTGTVKPDEQGKWCVSANWADVAGASPMEDIRRCAEQISKQRGMARTVCKVHSIAAFQSRLRRLFPDPKCEGAIAAIKEGGLFGGFEIQVDPSCNPNGEPWPTQVGGVKS